MVTVGHVLKPDGEWVGVGPDQAATRTIGREMIDPWHWEATVMKKKAQHRGKASQANSILRLPELFCSMRREFLAGAAALAGGVARAAVRRPNIVVVLMDDLRWDELHCTGPSLRANAQYRSHGRRGCHFPQRVCDVAALLAQPGVFPHRPIRAYTRHYGQYRPQPG